MMKKHHLGTLLASSALVLTVGCATKNTVPAEEPALIETSAAIIPAPIITAAPAVIAPPPVIEKKVVSLPPLNNVIVLFGFDSAKLQASEADIVETHAQYLLEHPDQRLVLEGHTDERGAASYNEALGQSRAIAIETALLAQGIESNQIRIVSFGEKQPQIDGQTEASWRSNRRVTFVYELSDEQTAAIKSSGANTFVLTD